MILSQKQAELEDYKLHLRNNEIEMSKFDKIVKDYDNKLSLLTNEIDRFRGLAEKRKLEYDEIIIKYS